MSFASDLRSVHLPAAQDGAGGARFFTTKWTMILDAGTDGPGREAAMEQFARSYWYPIYAFIRRKGHDADAAQDLTQEFFAQLVQKSWLAGVDRRTTRFSSWLLQILSNFLVSDYRRQTAQKRGGHQVPVSLEMAAAEDWYGVEPRTEETPERIFERRFALAVLRSALGRMQADLQSAGRARLFEALSPFLSREPEPGEYDRVGATLEISNPAVASAVRRLRREYREAVRGEVAAGITDAAQVDEEMRHLMEALRGSEGRASEP